jgi:hypothetical protein
LYETGKPAAGVHLAAEASGMNGTVTAKTAADGSFLLPAMPFGRYRIRVQEGSGNWVAGDLSGATHPIMKRLRVPDLVLQRGVLLTGVVLDVETGEPIAGAVARADGAQSIIISPPTDDKGRYQLRVLPGRSQLYLPGIPEAYLRKESLAREVYIMPEQSQVEPFRLKRGLELTGTAVDEAGRPATGAQIRITTSSGLSGPFGWVDAEGRWTIKGIDLDQTPEGLLASDGSWEMTPVSLKLPTDRPLTLTLRRVK